MKKYYIGLMSGTSIDGLDAVLVDFGSHSVVKQAHRESIINPLRNLLFDLALEKENTIDALLQADLEFAKLSVKAVNTLLQKAKILATEVIALGSHGQTLRHNPTKGYTLQIGDPNLIAAQTGITTIADFRRKDLALGGQGAPLVPAFHRDFFYSHSIPRAILNIGGIANLSLLADSPQQTQGFDVGPGNCLMDAWIQQTLNKPYDAEGSWAASGQIIKTLLEELLKDHYFKSPPPKSTGTQYFNLAWLLPFLNKKNYRPQDIQATLLELSACSIATAVNQYAHDKKELVVCGGGVFNDYLMQRLKKLLALQQIYSSAELGLDPTQVEACAFAWLAKKTLEKEAGNIAQVTGAKRAAILGGIYYA